MVYFNCHGPLGAVSVSEVPKMLMDQQRTIIMPDSEMTDGMRNMQHRRPRSHTGNRTIDGQHQARVRSQSAKLGNRRITLDSSEMCNSADFATSVFTELPEDLQEILSPSLGGRCLAKLLINTFMLCFPIIKKKRLT